MEATVCATHGAMGSVLRKLGALLSDEYKLLTSVKGDIMFLKAELESIHAFLKKISEFEDPDELSKCWIKAVRELSYDIEGGIDSFMLSLGAESSRKSRGCKGLLSRCMDLMTNSKTRHRMAKKIKVLKQRAIEVSSRRVRYKVDDVFSRPSRTSIDPRLPAFFTEMTRLIGIDGPRDKLIKLLTEGECSTAQQLKVVSIVGFGGLGKTTLANQVYQKLEGQFEYQAFVSVSQKPDLKKILRNILSQICWQECTSNEAWDEQQLINKIRQFLKHKRYFIVIDDIWGTPVWRTIKCAFPENNSSSRILTTTRIITVAKYCSSQHHDRVYEIKPLSATHSKSLFFKRAFGSEGGCPLQLREVSDEILKKCGGVPLAIITVASLLANKASTKEEWLRIRNSIGSALEKDLDMEEMKKILFLSYNDLPYHLKTCLLYLSIFPEDYEIKRDRLVRRWIAEGFINPAGGQDLEEVGEGYFIELINRSLIEPVEIQYDGRADACRVHDMILDLIISKSIEENFVTFSGDKKLNSLPYDKVRRLSLNYHAQEHIMVPSNMIVSHVRSLTIFGCAEAEHMLSLSKFHSVRVLDLENREVLEHNYLKHISRLSQLKYLRLDVRRITALPEQLGELQNLQTLDLRWTWVKKLPVNIVQLQKLACLLVNCTELPERIGNMQALRELSEVEINQNTSPSSLQELGTLTKLRILGLNLNWHISNTNGGMKAYTDNLVMSLCKLGMLNLRTIQIQSYNFCSLDFLLDSWFPPPRLLQRFEISTEYYFPRIPKWVASLDHLSYLGIYVDPVDEETFRILGDLPSLLFLWISSRTARPKERLIISSNGFRFLKEFYFTCWDSGTGLVFEGGAMPELEKLRVPFNAHDVFPLSGGLDFGIQNLYSLKHLHVEIVCYSAKVREVEALEDAVKNAAGCLSDELTLEMSRWDEEEIVKDGDHKLAEEVDSDN
ncbi:disease resistance protein RGA5-like [Triticum dicoccoides]|uniref:disease resistance protein RGA5-like n=1 Tax=Triticum dicoccoides TaxID=85692 RepID=UPI000E79B5C1|nr:disease resistance protein RGA5-like [Triticum dicoccoides]XP_037433000.1 disease resistance protein RGA5-like [Triticum dicoccoides]XP_037433001.1 disease resistance protein RGA5-like [Triticum dicoccoides]XP_037433002.1 disease resistance protein RGA5-like [Triticum dicoccoides]XP_037433003.1 disease resistance protein RGA5-like [Triticum dicoccoides]XP_037433004.1 disease resistance protein RGA5-like [Triticum dicoccoides]